MIKSTNERKALILPGARNILMIIPALFFNVAHSVSWGYTNDVLTDRYDNWNFDIMISALWIAFIIYLVCAIIDRLFIAKSKNKHSK